MKSMTEESKDENSDLLFELEMLIEVWGDARVQNENMAKLLKKQNGRTDCMARGSALSMSYCINELKVIINKYKE